MKRFKKLYLLLGVLAVACLAMVIILNVEQKKEKIKNTQAVILAVPPDSVDSLSWEYEDTALSFHRDGGWTWDEDPAFPVDEEKINKLLSVFESLTASFEIDDADDYGQYGLDKPVCTICFSAEGKSYEVQLGDYSGMDSERYVSLGDGKVYLLSDDPYDAFAVTLSDTALNDKTPSLTSAKVTELSFSGTVTGTIAYEEDNGASYCAEDVYYLQEKGKSLPLDTELVNSYLKKITLLGLTDYVSYDVTEEELAAWGLDSPELSIAVSYTVSSDNETETNESFLLHLGRNQEQLQAKATAEAADEEYTGSVTAYARVGDSRLVYEISDADYEALTAVSYSDLRHKEVLTADFESVTGLIVSLDGESYPIAAVPADEEVDEGAETSYTLDGEEMDISGIQTAIEALTISEFCDTVPEDREEIRVIFELNNDDYPQVTLSLYRYDGSSCLAVLDGETLGLVTRTSVVDLTEAVRSLVLG